ncbi:hypothetical protein CI610_03536 [invertebrate metagenome]|uniref:Uncharacterized protein n=1 Tax=invertebrate metagenome TaxID=1711999 RepID=A0A2H9T2T7_9ZZZZ
MGVLGYINISFIHICKVGVMSHPILLFLHQILSDTKRCRIIPRFHIVVRSGPTPDMVTGPEKTRATCTVTVRFNLDSFTKLIEISVL